LITGRLTAGLAAVPFDHGTSGRLTAGLDAVPYDPSKRMNIESTSSKIMIPKVMVPNVASPR
jgi:hypothetical protein